MSGRTKRGGEREGMTDLIILGFCSRSTGLFMRSCHLQSCGGSEGKRALVPVSGFFHLRGGVHIIPPLYDPHVPRPLHRLARAHRGNGKRIHTRAYHPIIVCVSTADGGAPYLGLFQGGRRRRGGEWNAHSIYFFFPSQGQMGKDFPFPVPSLSLSFIQGLQRMR